MKRVTALLALASCNWIYGLDKTEPATDPTRDDRDADGVVDAIDNCIDDPNPTQADEDRDTVGNVCDNCPLIANADQENLGDRDEVGDRCDPRPAHDDDCLVLFESFDDPGFASHWMQFGAAQLERRE